MSGGTEKIGDLMAKAPTRPTTLEDLQRLVARHGWICTRSRKNHLVFRHPDHPGQVVTGTTISDHRGIRNALREFHQRGLPRGAT